MYQSFKTPSSPETGAPRLKALRAALASAGLDGFLIPRADAHRGENVAPCDERLAWLTGFTGSDGHCAVLPNIAGVFVDGRYTLQIRSQIDLEAFTPQAIPEDRLSDWLKTHLGKGTVGYDPMLHSYDEISKLEGALSPEITLTQCANMVDEIWADRPAPPTGQIRPHPLEFAGKFSADKRAELAAELRNAGLDATVLTLPDSIAWLLNIRGSDIANTPVPLAFAVLHADARVTLITNPAKSSPELAAHLGPDVTISADFEAALKALTGKTGVDRASAPIWVSQQLANPAWFADPCIMPKACKNEAELNGSRQAHLRDAAAMCEFLAWIDRGISGKTEIDVVTKLEAFRAQSNALTDISFDTICGTGPNGAIVHYRVDEASNRTIEPNTLLLVDSGGQYLDGTTDITRTVPIGTPDSEMIRCFTLVLKGMLALSMLRFPDGISGADIDTLARAPLWAEGLDYKHGTGHGVGAYLSVHEGPARISRAGSVPLQTGMILSNEPGYYREGAWGIRIENLLIVSPPENVGGEGNMRSFETLTWVPIDTRLIDPIRLTAPERAWFNAYHADVQAKIEPQLSLEARTWLTQACAPI
ncbi:MAG TPA: aminopeptidase P family protein [Rhodobacteraceae bacterium]|nr:aminopeptidase P family protein [Paracoccaceae bacterium]